MESAPSIIAHSEPVELMTKNFDLTFNNKTYLLTLTLKGIEDKKPTPIPTPTPTPTPTPNFKVINFSLSEKNSNLLDIVSYETEKNVEELAKLFLINISKYPNVEEIIISKIENFLSKNNVSVLKNENNEDILNLVFIKKIVDDDDYEIKIELNKRSNESSDENDILKISKSFNNLSKELEDMRLSFEVKLKEKEEENNNLKKLLKMTKTAKGLEPLVFKSDPSKLTQCFELNEVVDGGRGMNDHFAIYNLVKDPKKIVYVAIKNKASDSQNSYINIIKIKSVNDYSIIQTLKGHNQRIVFVKYYLDPYTDNEYLLSADKEEVVIVWKICDKNNYKRFCYINTFYGQLLMRQSIYSCILFFTEKKNYIYTSSVTKNYSRLYELEDGSFLRNVVLTLNNYTLHLIKYKEYIIDICWGYIMIYNPFSEELYDKIENKETYGENRSGCIVYNKDNTDYLIITNQYGYLIIYDLIKKSIFKTISSDGDFYHITPWNLNYFIVAVHNYNALWIVDFDGEIDKKTFTKADAHLICVKHFILNGEEVIFCAGGQGYNSLYIYYHPK